MASLARIAAWLQHRGKRHRPSVTTFADPISFSQRLLSDHDLADFGHCQGAREIAKVAGERMDLETASIDHGCAERQPCPVTICGA
jgi:hypothetical protein